MLSTFCLASFLFVAPPKVTVGRETTYITGPLRADGTVDYLAWANEPLKQLKPADNAAVDLVRAVGPKAVREEVATEYFRLLGCERSAEGGEYLVQLHAMSGFPRHAEDQDGVFLRLFKCQESPWKAADAPLLAEWLRRNERPLEIVVEASRRTRYLEPIVSAAKFPGLYKSSDLDSGLRLSVELLSVRAMEKLGRGKTAEAIADLDVIHRWSSLFAHARGDTIAAFTACAARNTALVAEASVAKHGAMTPAEQRERARQLLKLEAAESLFDPVSPYERLVCITMMWGTMLEGIEGRLKPDGSPPDKPKPYPPAAIDEALRQVNVWFDRFAGAIHQTGADRQTQIDRLEKELEEAVAKAEERQATGREASAAIEGREQAERFLLLPVGALRAATNARKHMACRQRLAVLAHLLRAYRQEHGAYPEKLDASVLGTITEVLVDPFTNKPFVYHMKDGKVRVASPGPDGKVDPLGFPGTDDKVLELP